MTKFTIKAWTGHEVKIEVADTLKEFKERLKNKYKMDGARAVCYYSSSEKEQKWIADVLFFKGDMNVGTIAHELTHAVTGLATKKGWSLNYTPANEKIANNLGKLVGDCCKELNRLGYVIKFCN